MPTSRKGVSTFQTFCPVRVQVAPWQFILPTFKFRPGKRVFWGGTGGVLCLYISPNGRVWRFSKEQGLVKERKEKRKRKKRKKEERKNCTTSVLYVRRSLQELAAQEELALFYKSFWCLSHHLCHEEEWWSSVLLHDTDSKCSQIREQGAGWLQAATEFGVGQTEIEW